MSFRIGDKVKHLASNRIGLVMFIPKNPPGGFDMMEVLFEGQSRTQKYANNKRFFELVEKSKGKNEWESLWDESAT